MLPPDPIAAAREFLPAWVVWAPVAGLAFGAAVSTVIAAAAVAWGSRPLRRLPPDAHWTERARLVWPVRRALVVAWVLGLVASAPTALGGPLSLPGALGRWTADPLLTLAAVLAVGFEFENRLVRPLPWRARWLSAAGWALLVSPAYWVSGAFALWAARVQAPRAASLAAGALVVVLVLGAAPWLGRAVRLVAPAPPRLRSALERARRTAGGRPARLLVLPIASANAFALQLTRTVAVTRGMLDQLDDPELEAVLAHELGHLDEPAAVVLLRTAVAALVPVLLVIFPIVSDLRSPATWPVLLLVALVVLLLFRRVQRALERRADAAGTAASPVYGAALEKIYRANLTPAVLRRAATHPDLADRMQAAGAPPPWPPPAPPPSLLPALVLMSVLALAAAAGGLQARAIAQELDDGDDAYAPLAVRVAVDGRAFDVGRLGYWHLGRREHGAALALFRAAEAMAPASAEWPAFVATVLAYEGRCAEADDAAVRAGSRDPASPYVRAARALVAVCAPRRTATDVTSSPAAPATAAAAPSP